MYGLIRAFEDVQRESDWQRPKSAQGKWRSKVKGQLLEEYDVKALDSKPPTRRSQSASSRRRSSRSIFPHSAAATELPRVPRNRDSRRGPPRAPPSGRGSAHFPLRAHPLPQLFRRGVQFCFPALFAWVESTSSHGRHHRHGGPSSFPAASSLPRSSGDAPGHPGAAHSGCRRSPVPCRASHPQARPPSHESQHRRCPCDVGRESLRPLALPSRDLGFRLAALHPAAEGDRPADLRHVSRIATPVYDTPRCRCVTTHPGPLIVLVWRADRSRGPPWFAASQGCTLSLERGRDLRSLKRWAAHRPVHPLIDPRWLRTTYKKALVTMVRSPTSVDYVRQAPRHHELQRPEPCKGRHVASRGREDVARQHAGLHRFPHLGR